MRLFSPHILAQFRLDLIASNFANEHFFLFNSFLGFLFHLINENLFNYFYLSRCQCSRRSIFRPRRIPSWPQLPAADQAIKLVRPSLAKHDTNRSQPAFPLFHLVWLWDRERACVSGKRVDAHLCVVRVSDVCMGVKERIKKTRVCGCVWFALHGFCVCVCVHMS